MQTNTVGGFIRDRAARDAGRSINGTSLLFSLSDRERDKPDRPRLKAGPEPVEGPLLREEAPCDGQDAAPPVESRGGIR